MLVGNGVFTQDEINAPATVYNYSGTKLYTMSLGDNTVYEYDLSTAFDISTISLPVATYGIAENEGQGIYLSQDGTSMILIGSSGDDLEQHDLSTAFSISTASFTREIVLGSDNWTGVFVKPDGLKVFYTGSNQDLVIQRTLNNSYSLLNASGETSFNVSNEQGVINGVSFDDTGNKMFIVGSTPANVHAYDLSTAWDVTTATYNAENVDVSNESTGPQAVRFNNDGTKMYLIDTGSTIYEYALSTSWDVSSATFTTSITISGSLNSRSLCWG